MTLANVLTDVTSIVTSAIDWMEAFVTAITSNPILLLFVLVPLIGLGIGLIKRALRA